MGGKILDGKKALQYIQANPRVAVVGLSPKPERPSFVVASFLIDRGLQVVPVHPNATEILGVEVLPSLAELSPGEVDWVDLFVRPDRLMGLWPDIKRLRPGLVWCQLGVLDLDFNRLLEEEGLNYIADKCPKIEWSRHECVYLPA